MTAGPAEGPFQILLPYFHGTVPALLQNVAERRLAPDDVKLSEVTQQLAAHVTNAGVLNLDEAGDAVRGVARLILLKSERLLFVPVQVTQDPGSFETADLAGEREYSRAIAAHLRDRQTMECFPSVTGLAVRPEQLEPRSSGEILRAWERILQRASKDVASVRPAIFVRLEAALSTLIQGLGSTRRFSFLRAIRGSNRNDAVVHFLAALELIRRGQASAGQAELFGDIVLAPVKSDADTRTLAG